MDDSSRRSLVYRFGTFEADLYNSRLTRKGVRVRLQDQPLRILELLLRTPGQVVTREQLRQELWPDGIYVNYEGSLNAALKRLRAALDDDPNNPRFVETVPKRGYRFIAPVEIVTRPVPAAPGPAHSAQNTKVTEPERPPESIAQANVQSVPAIKRKIFGWTAAVVAAALLVLLVASRNGLWKRATASAKSMPELSVAVLPFSNDGAGSAFDYLRFALADDIVTDLTYAHSVSVRPFASTSRYASEPKDPRTVGSEMNVSYVISGDFVAEAGHLDVTVELTRVADNRVLWRGSISGKQREPMRLHEELAERVQNGLLAALGDSESFTHSIPAPHDQQAFELYMRSVAVPRDPAPNKAAIKDLEQSVAEDPDYAPAWSELGWRYYLDAEYADGGETSYQKAAAANARAVALDPNGTANSVTLKAEHGDLQGAYDEARSLLSRRPDASAAHYQMSYVYRYAGMLDKSAQECNAALAIDPGFFLFRSCSKVFMYEGDYARAQTFIDLDGNSGWSVRQKMQFALREKKFPEALSLATIAVESGYTDSEIVVARLEREPPAIVQEIAQREETDALKQHDPEEKYEVASLLSFAGQSNRAVRVLKAAIQENYCASALLDADPLLAGLRARPDFAQLKSAAAACQQRFVAYAAAENSGRFSSNR